MRRFGEPVREGPYYRPRPGAYAIIWHGDRLLMTVQHKPYYELQLPGGGIDAGEGQLAALHREAFEETGWRIAPVRRLGAYRRYTYMPEYERWAAKTCHIWLARAIMRYAPPSEPYHEVRSLHPGEVMDQLRLAGDADFLRRHLAGLI
jgi:8-oxo-dGTP diphosphatase